jgi:hypothetical protein
MAKKFRYKHISSIIEDRVPSELLDGEIAVNRFAGKEKLFIKNSSGQIISFIPEHDVTTLISNLTEQLAELSSSTIDEIARAQSAETVLQEEIDIVSAHTTTLAIACAEDFKELSGSLKTLTIAIGEDFDEFEYNINQLSSSTKQIESSVSGIVGDNIRELSASVITLSSSTEDIAGDLHDEVTRATNVDNTLSGNVTTLSGNVITLSGNVTTLSGNLDTLAIAATEDIDELQYQVDIKTALLDEKVDNEITRARTSEQSVSGAVQTLSAGTLNTFTRKPVTIWETDGTRGLLGVNNSTMDLSNSWQLENLDFTPYKFVLAYFKQADTGATATAATPSVVCTIPLDSASLSTGYTAYVGGAGGTNPNNRDIHFQVLCAIDSTKTKFQVVSEHSIAGTILAQKNDNGRYCYKIVGYYE